MMEPPSASCVSGMACFGPRNVLLAWMFNWVSHNYPVVSSTGYRAPVLGLLSRMSNLPMRKCFRRKV